MVNQPPESPVSSQVLDVLLDEQGVGLGVDVLLSPMEPKATPAGRRDAMVGVKTGFSPTHTMMLLTKKQQVERTFLTPYLATGKSKPLNHSF